MPDGHEKSTADVDVGVVVALRVGRVSPQNQGQPGERRIAFE